MVLSKFDQSGYDPIARWSCGGAALKDSEQLIGGQSRRLRAFAFRRNSIRRRVVIGPASELQASLFGRLFRRHLRRGKATGRLYVKTEFRKSSRASEVC